MPEAAKWKPLELYRTIYRDDPEFDNLDKLYPLDSLVYEERDDKGEIVKVIIARTWPHEFGAGDDAETALYGPNDQ